MEFRCMWCPSNRTKTNKRGKNGELNAQTSKIHGKRTTANSITTAFFLRKNIASYKNNRIFMYFELVYMI